MQPLFFTRARRRATGLLTGSLLMLIISCGGPAPTEVGRTETPRGKQPPQTSLPMPPTTTTAAGSASAQGFTLLNNERGRLSDYAGQVVVLDFWATYCAPCLEEAPRLDALQTRFAAQGLRVIGLNVGGPEDHPKIQEFAERLKLKYTLGIPEPEMTNLFMGGDNRIPQTLVLDRAGRVVKHFIGYDQTVTQQLESTVEKLVMGDR